MGVAPTRKEDKVMRLTIDGREVESLSVALTDAEGKTSEHAIAASALAAKLARGAPTNLAIRIARQPSLETIITVF